MNQLVAPLALVCAAASAACADFIDYTWDLVDTAGGSAYYYPDSMTILGGEAGKKGVTEYTAVACVDCTIHAYVDYTTADYGKRDYVYHTINGKVTVIADNDGQGYAIPVDFDVKAGDTFGWGVATTDGMNGAGQAVFYDFYTISHLDFSSLGWYAYDDAGGATTLPPPVLQIVGGDIGVKGSTEIGTYAETPMTINFKGNYSSVDGGVYDYAFIYGAINGKYTLATNDTQGDFESSYGLYGSEFVTFGVVTEDGLSGPGVLVVDEFSADAYPAHLGDIPWYLYDNAGGYGDLQLPSETMTIVGGDAVTPGVTEFQAIYSAGVDLCVRVYASYSSPDIEEYDYAYYAINGQQTVIATNDSQGGYALEFHLKRGQAYSFGVATADGEGGPGRLDLALFRGFADSAGGCYADFNGDGSLDIFDFLAYVNRFNAGDATADCDGNGAYDLFDFLCFVNAFNQGC